MADGQVFRSAPSIPDEGQPFVLRRRALVWLLALQPVVWLGILSPLCIPAVSPSGVPWTLLVLVLPFMIVVLFAIVRVMSRVTGIWLAADPGGVWVRARSRTGTDAFAIRVPWDHVESIFAIQTSRTGISGGPWTLVVRVKDLPATLRPPDEREAQRWTFTVSMWLSNYSAREAIDVLTRLAAGRAAFG
ncbi:hypothetical protein [Plantactinospora sp. KLBMP9567]|uniref:hypothetical protein n=1 Tax=Plantactinospora sp. KLBMP9567 TaxID=3085900 RepID=UPI00298142DF|nr:hypothetical protein [Plantactinospora sp. KLBMP9567]MDW5329064.1 hypothetical protein [Plantactinospora sp. KLBMP9567]